MCACEDNVSSSPGAQEGLGTRLVSLDLPDSCSADTHGSGRSRLGAILYNLAFFNQITKEELLFVDAEI